MEFGKLNNFILNQKLVENNIDCSYTVSDDVDEHGRYVINTEMSETEFFTRLGYRTLSDVQNDFNNIENDNK